MWVCERVSESVSARMRAYGRECARIRVFFPSDYINTHSYVLSAWISVITGPTNEYKMRGSLLYLIVN